ncbi:MAG: DNA polymerase III subunit gamma/tau [Verrucomicrobia bacterium]|nr:DNA polymerase III subunit gamma/tau [Verrucomicrobiota bacterium]
MSYRVFARKYRPQTFAEVVGQEHITRTLQNAVNSSRLAQAYLFVGPRGIGKTSTARILAKALNCEAGPTSEPCGKCPACLEIAEGRSLDVIEIDGASNNGVENIRDLRDSAAYAPARGKFKIYLIDEVHMLSTGAFNALLKTLEEPPPHVKFIFATTEAQKVPATITSRCQRFDLRRIPTHLIKKHLLFIAEKEKIQLDGEAADAIARGAEGGLRDAESMLDQMVAFCGEHIRASDVMDVFGFTPHEVVVSLADSLFAGDASAALDTVAAQSNLGKDLSRLTAELVSHLRDLLVSQATGGECAIPQGKLLDLVDHFSAAESAMKWVADKKLQLDVAVIKALHLLDETSLTDVIETLTGLCNGEPPAPRPERPARVAPIAATPPPAPAPVLPPSPAPVPEPAPPAPVVSAPVEPQPVLEIEAPKPAPAVVRTPPPVVPKAAPAPDPEPAAPVDAALCWERIAAEFSKNSVIRFGWFREGVFDRLEGGRLIVRFPAALQEAGSSMFMEKGIKDIEARLLQDLGQPTKIVFEFDEALQAAAPEPEPEPEPDVPKITEPVVEAPPVDPMEEFLNDPLIEKALEIFKGTLQTQKT